MPIIIHNGCALCDLPCRRNAQFGWTNPGRGCGMSGQGNTGRRQRVVIVGGGFAGFHAARSLAPLATTCRGVRHVLGAVAELDMADRQVVARDPEGNRRVLGYDQLVLALGSVNKLLPIPGVADRAHGFRSMAEAMYLRDHLLRQVELADLSDDPAERAARCTFVVVGAGYTGTEVAAHGQLLIRAAVRRRPGLFGQQLRWLL